MRISFKRKEYRTYELDDDLVKRAVQQEGLRGFTDMLLSTEEPFTAFEDQWELLEADKEELKGLLKK